jgi:hypothetical protein
MPKNNIDHANHGGDFCDEGPDGCCSDCGVYLDRCNECGGKGYHRAKCAELDAPDVAALRAEIRTLRLDLEDAQSHVRGLQQVLAERYEDRRASATADTLPPAEVAS